MRTKNKDIYDSVLTIGPDIAAPGGMAAVMQSLREIIKPFHYRRTNSQKGTVAGLFVLAGLLCCLPFDRLRGRKILHIHSASGKSFIRKSVIILWANLWGYKIICHIHGGKLPSFFNKIGIKNAAKIIKRCNVIVVLTEGWQQYFKEKFKNPNVCIVPNFVDPIPPTSLSTQEGALKLLFLGNINHDKGIFDLLAVINEQKTNWIEKIHLSICGVGPDLQEMQDIIKASGLESFVSYLGYVKNEAKIRAIQDCDAIVLPSYFEAQPVCILEGMAAGKGIIASNVGGIPDMINDGTNGILISPGDKDALTSAISSYIDNRDLLGRHAKAALEKSKEYSVEMVINKLNVIYSQLL